MIITKKILTAVSEYRILCARMLREFLRAGENYYISGPDTLPPPLSAEEEASAIRLKDTDSEAASRLIEHNLRLVVYIAKKFENTGCGIDDLISIGTIGLIKGVRTFKAEKNIRLATYASRCIENEILMYIRKTAPHRNDVSIDEPLNCDGDGGELLLCDVLGTDSDTVSRDMEKSEDEKTVRAALETLDGREKRIMKLRYGIDGEREFTQKEVADMMGISQSYISRLEKKIIRKLKAEVAGKI